MAVPRLACLTRHRLAGLRSVLEADQAARRSMAMARGRSGGYAGSGLDRAVRDSATDALIGPFGGAANMTDRLASASMIGEVRGRGWPVVADELSRLHRGMVAGSDRAVAMGAMPTVDVEELSRAVARAVAQDVAEHTPAEVAAPDSPLQTWAQEEFAEHVAALVATNAPSRRTALIDAIFVSLCFYLLQMLGPAPPNASGPVPPQSSPPAVVAPVPSLHVHITVEAPHAPSKREGKKGKLGTATSRRPRESR
jgi:hypothetical protein